MFDFTAIKKAITDDLRSICINNYLILNEINVLPKELINEIIYYTFITTDEIIKLEQDIINLEKDSLSRLINTCFNPYNNIDILSPEYNDYIDWDINKERLNITDFIEYNKMIIKGSEKLYSLNNDIFDILFKRYYDQNESLGQRYIINYKKNINFYMDQMKISTKYSSLLFIKTNF